MPLVSRNSRHAFDKDGFPIHECMHCGHRFAALQTDADHLSQVYGDAYFFEGGAGYPNYLRNEQLLRRHGRQLAGKVRKDISQGRVLDVGCAAGFVLRGFQDAGWTGVGIEPNPKMADHATQYCDCPVHCGTMADFPTKSPDFDLVAMIQVAAHFADPMTAFQQAHALTRPSGFLFIETWNVNSWSAKLMGRNWHEYSPPSVLHWFRFPGMKMAIEQIGYRQVAGGWLLKRISGSHAKSLAGSKLSDVPGGKLMMPLLGMVPDNLTIPYLSDDLGWLLFQKQT